ncbi:aromatic acid/H+ symport family MFS transporter [Amycolatopsis acidicola]|uniref:Aromatic acid/H+ symport family MFS transporter n=1 Tax=Amycolatopsis acidicola TaxID=2596893 RepID=A0A5N0UNQ0_9PSEU|nr:aromatic acid/H+ symport family MFS transporter [Amycolatopsis acidicola]KAA9151053.1 aromatic acid/H+ symport family MFS transporter [Amycolatopsis acidicola]
MSLSAPQVQAASRLSVRVTALCWILVLLDGLDLFVYGAILPRVLADKDFGLTAAGGGDVGSLTTFGMLLGALAAGMLTDVLGRRKIIITGVTVFSLASALCALAPDVTTFGIARFVAGVGLGGLLPSAIALVMEYAPSWRKNLAVTVVMTAHQAGGAVAGALGLSVAESLGWRSVFWLGAIPLVVVLPLIVKLLPESVAFLLAKGRTDKAEAIARRHGVPLEAFTPEKTEEQRSGLRSLFTPSLRMTTILFWIASFAGLLLVYGVSTWLPTMMRGNGYNLGSSISFLLVINIGGIAGLLVAGRLADRLGSRRVAIAWFALTAAGVALMAIPMPLPLTYVVVFLTGAWLFSAQTLIYAATGSYYPAAGRATALGWVSGIGRFGAVFGPWLGGVLVAGGLSKLGFAVFAVAGVLGAVMLLCVRRAPLAAAAAPVPLDH